MKLSTLTTLALSATAISAAPTGDSTASADSSPVTEAAGGPSPTVSPEDYNPPQGPGLYEASRTAVQIALSNLIGAFGIGAAASSLTSDDIGWACNGMQESDLYKPWKDFTSREGEYALQSYICAAEPRIPPILEIVTTIRRSTAQIFTNQLLKSFPPPYQGSPVWQRVCYDLDYNKLLRFGVNSTHVDPIRSVCNLYGLPAQPRALHPPGGPDNSTDVSKMRTSTTTLTARTLYVAISTTERRKYVCDRFPLFVRFLLGAGLEIPRFERELCKQPADLPIASAEQRAMEASSSHYVMQILNTGTSETWKQFLCENLSPRDMETIGLDGDLVKHAVCEGDI